MIDSKFKSERMWSLDTLVEALGVKRSWVYEMTSQRRLPHRKIGGKLRFDPIEIDRWIETQPGCSLKISESLVSRRKE